MKFESMEGESTMTVGVHDTTKRVPLKAKGHTNAEVAVKMDVQLYMVTLLSR